MSLKAACFADHNLPTRPTVAMGNPKRADIVGSLNVRSVERDLHEQSSLQSSVLVRAILATKRHWGNRNIWQKTVDVSHALISKGNEISTAAPRTESGERRYFSATITHAKAAGGAVAGYKRITSNHSPRIQHFGIIYQTAELYVLIAIGLRLLTAGVDIGSNAEGNKRLAQEVFDFD